MAGMWQWQRLTTPCKMFASSIRRSSCPAPDFEIDAGKDYIRIIFQCHGAIKYADIKRIHLQKEMLEILLCGLMICTHDAKLACC